MKTFKEFMIEVKLGKNPCWAGYAPVKGDELKKKNGKFVPNCVKEDGEGGGMNVGAIAGSGDARLPTDQREPGVSKKKNPVMMGIERRKAPQ